MTGMDINRGCTPSPAWAGAVDAVGLSLPGAGGAVGSALTGVADGGGSSGSGGARSMSGKGLSR